jgi:hypothetical protein
MTTTPTNNLDKGFALKHIIAILLLVAYGIFMIYLLKVIETKEPTWSRMMMLFTSLEALAFTAAGYIFGREVHKKRAEIAESDKDKAQKETDEAKKEKQIERDKGLSLASMLVGNSGGPGLTGFQGLGVKPLDDDGGRGNTSSIILDKAKEFYPELQ